MIYKCKLCGQPINSEEYDSYTIDGSSSKSYYHIPCFIEKKTKRSRQKWTENECTDYIEKQSKLIEEQMKSNVLKDKMYKWIMEEYDMASLPSYFFTKTATVFNGTYQGLSKPIPVDDLFDMWQKKKNYLDKLWMNKYPNGQLNDQRRLTYDLAVLVGKYTSYLKWKKEKEIEKQTIETRQLEANIPKYVQRNDITVHYDNNELNLADILNEI